MADFKTHVSVGAATGFAVAIVSYNWNLIPHAYMAIIVFFATVIGSFLPDTDSQPGLPVRMIFGFYAYFLAAMSLFWMHKAGANLPIKILVPAAVFYFVIKFLKDTFQKYTSHRGIFHSVPAWILSFLIPLFIASTTRLSIREQFVIAFAVSCGYFCHLLLDEIYSINGLSDKKTRQKTPMKEIFKKYFNLKKSFGTALDLGFNQKEKYPGIIAWILVTVFFFLCQSTIWDLIKLIGKGI